MARFEEVQMFILETATKYLELNQMQVLTEQFTLDRESNITLSLPNSETQQFITAEISFVYDAFQTGFSLINEEFREEEPDVDTTIDLEFTVKFPFIKDYPDINGLFDELSNMLEDADPTLLIKEHIDLTDVYKTYELVYFYEIDFIEDMEVELFDEIFRELRDVMQFILEKTEPYIDHSWYNESI